MNNALYKKLLLQRVWKRIYMERLGEPLIYNLAALVALGFGKYTTKIRYDLVPRQPYAFGIDYARRLGKARGITKLALLEFGVAAGAGLLNMVTIADRLAREEGGVEFRIIGDHSGF